MLVVAVTFAGATLISPYGARDVEAVIPVDGVQFNNPISSDPYYENTLLRAMANGIEGTKAGATIRWVFFSLTTGFIVDKLIAAHRRGVNVRVLQDDHEIGPLWKKLISVIGKDTSKRSWGLLCHRSCFSDEDPSYLHTKLYMFSSTRGVPYVVMTSSANPTYTQARVGWNDLYTITRNATIYNAAKKHFEDLTRGAIRDRDGNQSAHKPIDYYWDVTSGKYKMYFFPQAGDDRFTDTMWLVMRNIRCGGTASGYGSGGKTIIKVAMYQWSYLRIRLANELWRLDDEGCIVDIIYDPTVTDREIVAALKAPGGRHGGPKLLKAHDPDRDGDGMPTNFVHFKFMLVNGVYAGDTSTKVVFTGSANWTNTALRYGNELMLKIVDGRVHDKYVAQFEKLRTWAKSIPPTPPPPTPTPTPRPTGTPRPTATPGPTGTPGPSPTVVPSPTLGPSASPLITAAPTGLETAPPEAASLVPGALEQSGLEALGLQGLVEELWLESYSTPREGPAEERLPTAWE